MLSKLFYNYLLTFFIFSTGAYDVFTEEEPVDDFDSLFTMRTIDEYYQSADNKEQKSDTTTKSTKLRDNLPIPRAHEKEFFPEYLTVNNSEEVDTNPLKIIDKILRNPSKSNSSSVIKKKLKIYNKPKLNNGTKFKNKIKSRNNKHELIFKFTNYSKISSDNMFNILDNMPKTTKKSTLEKLAQKLGI